MSGHDLPSGVLVSSPSGGDDLARLLDGSGLFSAVVSVPSPEELVDIAGEGGMFLAVVNIVAGGEAELIPILGKLSSMGVQVLALCPKGYPRRMVDRLEAQGAVTLFKPVQPRLVLETARILKAMHARLTALIEKNISLQTKYDDIRLINWAKLILIERFKMTEQQAHKYIEKQAMDLCVKRRNVAEKIIRTYED